MKPEDITANRIAETVRKNLYPSQAIGDIRWLLQERERLLERLRIARDCHEWQQNGAPE